MGNKTFDFSSKKKGFFAQKRPNLAQNWHFWSIWARPCMLIHCPVGGSVGGCGARAVSRKTPIYFIYLINSVKEIFEAYQHHLFRCTAMRRGLPNLSREDTFSNNLFEFLLFLQRIDLYLYITCNQ